MPSLLQTLWTDFPQQAYHIQTTTSACIPRYLHWIPRELSRLASLLSWPPPAHQYHSRRLLWQRLQLSPCLWFKTLCRSHSHPISSRSKWTPKLWQFWTISCPPNWIPCQPWHYTIHLHWIIPWLWTTFTSSRQRNFNPWPWRKYYWWHWSYHRQWHLSWSSTTNTSADQPDLPPKETHSTTTRNDLILQRVCQIPTIYRSYSYRHASHRCLLLPQLMKQLISISLNRNPSELFSNLTMMSATLGYTLSAWKSRT